MVVSSSSRQRRQPRLDLHDRGVCRLEHSGTAFRSSPLDCILNRKTQEVEPCLGGVHDLGFGLVEAQSQSLQDMAHHVQRFLDILTAQHDKVIRLAHQVRVQFAFAVLPLPYPIQLVQVAVGQQR